jgi:hypothetical protein
LAGAGGAIVTWQDRRSGNWDIYAQTVSASGAVPASDPSINAIQDVPHDQGSWVRITIGKSSADDVLEYSFPVSLYNVWQRVDNPALSEAADLTKGEGTLGSQMPELPLERPVGAASAPGWPVKMIDGRCFVTSGDVLGAASPPPGTWELIGSFAASQRAEYLYRASTLADSTASGTHYSVYFVSAHTMTPSVWFVSAPDSGYSVDNLPPGTPLDLGGQQLYAPVGLTLKWNRNMERDLNNYAIYRGSNESFVPGPSNLIGSPTDTMLFDSSWRWNSGYYYKVSAIDIHGNESGFALLMPADVTGTDTPKAPEASYLSQNYPNPFNPMTRIAFGLAAPGHVSLHIYDVAGRLVRDLVNEERTAGRYEATWDGRDANGRTVASGIYFYRLAAGAYGETKKMTLLR